MALPGKEPGTYLIEDHRIALIPVPQLLPALVNEKGCDPPNASRFVENRYAADAY